MARLTILQWGAVVSLLSLLMRQAQGEGQQLPSFSEVSSGGPLTKAQLKVVINDPVFQGYFPEGADDEKCDELMTQYDEDGDEKMNEYEYDIFCDDISNSNK